MTIPYSGTGEFAQRDTALHPPALTPATRPACCVRRATR